MTLLKDTSHRLEQCSSFDKFHVPSNRIISRCLFKNFKEDFLNDLPVIYLLQIPLIHSSYFKVILATDGVILPRTIETPAKLNPNEEEKV